MEGYHGAERPHDGPKHVNLYEGSENAPTEKRGAPKIEQRSINMIDPPSGSDSPEVQEKALESARTHILGNEKLYANFIKGLEQGKLNEGPRLASVQNHLTKYCVGLTDAQIDGIVRQFTVELNGWYIAHKGEYMLSQATEREIQTVGRAIKPEGIKAAVHYIRNRSNELRAVSGRDFTFGYENQLDVHYKIDLFELTYNIPSDSGIEIDEMNVVQIKNGIPTDEVAIEIESDHRAWALERMLSLEEFKKRKLESGDSNTPKEAFKERSEIQETLIDIMMSDETFNEESLLARLGLKGATNARKLLVLLENTRLFMDTLKDLAQEGYADAEWSERFRNIYNSVIAATAAKVGFPLKTAPVRTINSVIVAGGKIVRKTNLYSRPDDEEVGKFVAYA